MTWTLESITAEIRYPLPDGVGLEWWRGDYDELGTSRYVNGPPPRIEIGEVLRDSVTGELQVVHEWGHAVDHADLDWTQRRALANLWWGGLIEYHWGTPGTPYHRRAEEAFARWFMVAYGPERLRESSLTSMRSYEIPDDEATMTEAMRIVGHTPSTEAPMTWRQAFDFSKITTDTGLDLIEWAFEQVVPMEWGNSPDGKLRYTGDQAGNWITMEYQGALPYAGLYQGPSILINSSYRGWFDNHTSPDRDDVVTRGGAVVLHEAFHAWDHNTLTDDQRQALLDLWRGEVGMTWYGGDYAKRANEVFARAAIVAFVDGPIADQQIAYLPQKVIDTFPQFSEIVGIPLAVETEPVPGPGEPEPEPAPPPPPVKPPEPQPAATHGIFVFENPPTPEALEQCIAALDACDYPWERTFPELGEESEGEVRVRWDLDHAQGSTGHYVGGTVNEIVLSSRYTATQYGFVFLHEAGHMVDDTALRDDQRQALLEKWHTDLDGKYDGRIQNGEEIAWSHNQPHAHTEWSDGWIVTDATYFHKPNEAFADAFVACFAPSVFRYKRFAHWSDDLAGVREIILSEPEVGPEPSTFPNDTLYRLYRAYFLREPDQGGYDYWKAQADGGYPWEAISNDFARSAEFQDTYGHLDNEHFVRLVYRNVLERAPDSSGLAYWTGLLDQGVIRGRVMLGFSESAEYKAKIDQER